MVAARSSITTFSTTNPIYANATVTAFTVENSQKTNTKASLYSSISGAGLLSNPQVLDSYGKFKQPVYFEEPVILTVTGLGNTPDHDTGIIQIDDSRSVDVVISSAELLALQTTPKTLVAAPGVNKAIAFERAEVFLDYNSVAYADIASGDDLNIRYRYTDGSGTIAGTLETTGFLDQTSDIYAMIYPIADSLVLPLNAPLVASLGGAVTTGNSPLAIRVHYSIIDLFTLVTS